MNSERVRASTSKVPRMALETQVLFCLCTPRIIMQHSVGFDYRMIQDRIATTVMPVRRCKRVATVWAL